MDDEKDYRRGHSDVQMSRKSGRSTVRLRIASDGRQMRESAAMGAQSTTPTQLRLDKRNHIEKPLLDQPPGLG